MEIRARYILMGLFVLLVTATGFGFVYWLHNTSSFGEKIAYRVLFQSSVSGLRTGSAVLFNGMRVGEVTDLRFDIEAPKQVVATISIDRSTPVRADTLVDVEVQGLMGSPSIVLRGGAADAPVLTSSPGQMAVLMADPHAGRDTMQTARDVLQNIDKVVVENSAPLHSAITNIDTFAGALARNSDRLEQIVDGVIRFTGGTSQSKPAVYDIGAPQLRTEAPVPRGQLVVPEPTAVVALDSQRILIKRAEGAVTSPDEAQWSDTVPKLFQARIIQTFENADYVRVNRPLDAFSADYQLIIDLHRFQIDISPQAAGAIEFSAKLLNTGGQVLAAKVFRATAPASDIGAGAAVKALNTAFGEAANELVLWTFKTLSE